MWIFSASAGDPMLLDSCAGLRGLHERIRAFADAGDSTLVLPATTEGSPAPYERFLSGLRITKGKGKASLTLSADGWLDLSVEFIELRRFADVVLVKSETDHHHWHCNPISLVIEADTVWVEEHEAWAREK